ncbi:hypothetical protein B566_EDAN017149 [Ephemera danica]|nr:hypothetical protein B566_EDAN017149 [Ephemera danica]
MLKSGAKTLGHEALNAGFGVLEYAITRKPLRESLKSRMREAGSNLMNVAEEKIDTMKGSGSKTPSLGYFLVMSFINNLSFECTKAELNHFGLPPTQTSVEQGEWKRYKPIDSISSDAPLEFHVTGSSEEYTDVSQTFLFVSQSVH